MYAQHRGPSGIPQNYSGNAFRYPPVGQPIGQLPIEEDARQQIRSTALDEPASGDTPPLPLPTPALPPVEPIQNEMPPARHGLLSGLGELVGNEELLLIGLFLLLSGQSDKDGAASPLLYLLLLLFCG